MTLSAEDAKIINTSEKDIELLKCKSIDEIEEYIENNDYDINAQTIILACQHNIDAYIINHLLSYKINFDEKSVNEIIKSYRDNENIEKLLLFVNQYGYQFQKSNYLEMLSSQYYSVLFRGNIIKNLILDNELMERAYDTYKKYPINFETFLENIEFLGNQNQITADNIIVLYCGVGNAEKVKKLLKDYNTKLNTKCMQYLFKKTQVSKKLVELFKEKSNYICMNCWKIKNFY